MSESVHQEQGLQKCQKFTPKEMVHTLIHSAKYAKDLYGKKVLENSFGDGNILAEIVRLYIDDCQHQNMSADTIRSGLENDIYGFEISKKHFQNCINRLNKIAKEKGIIDIKWKNLKLDDFLTFTTDVLFDYVIANPPYLDYRDIQEESRNKLKNMFLSCQKGKFDYCYPFVERSIRLLNATGKLSMLLPINVYKNKFGEKLRNIMLDGAKKIIIYPGQNRFQDALTSSSIFVFDNAYKGNKIALENDTEKKIIYINKQNLNPTKWVFEESINKKNRLLLRFGDFFYASMVVATLYNKAFIISKEQIEKEKLEYSIIRTAASPRNFSNDKNEYIIFPYRYENNSIKRYSEEEFRLNFPNVTKHLSQYKESLLSRKSDKNSNWFEYGRTQGLRVLNQDKLLLSTIATQKVNVYELDSLTIPYAGIMITQKNPHYSLAKAKKILQSQGFFNYVKKVGITVNNSSIRILSSDINNYFFDKNEI